jgi:hypothetical protein
VLALAVIVVVPSALLIFVIIWPVTFSPHPSEVTSTVVATGQDPNAVRGDYSEHLLLLNSGNISAIVQLYEPKANITWEGALCLGGIYHATGGGGNLSQLLPIFFNYLGKGFVMGNVSQPLITDLSNASMLANSTFSLASSVPPITAVTVSAQDIYAYSSDAGVWLISSETWHFTFNTQLPICPG